ncbi:MAG: methylated-DNA--[protein]-cysteine S-methyltransferase, partial [Mobilitalea sp.]
MKSAYSYKTAIGEIFIVEENQAIIKVDLIQETASNERQTPSLEEYIAQETELIKETANQLIEYLRGERKEFSLKLNLKGTEFQKKVWDALCCIPYGETRSYKQIAEAAGSPKAMRAVGMANHNNPIMFIVPCHRVIGA